MLGSVDGVLEGQAALRLDSDGLMEGVKNKSKFEEVCTEGAQAMFKNGLFRPSWNS